MNNTITKIAQIAVAAALLVLAVGTFNLPASAADDKGFTIGKKGEVHFNVPVRAGDPGRGEAGDQAAGSKR